MKRAWKYLIVLVVYFLAITAHAADTTPPTVSAVSPSSGATNVWLDADVAATFSEQMSAGTVNSGTVLVRRGLTPVSGIVTYDAVSKTVTFTPYAPFDLGVTYTAMVTTGVQDAAGNRMSEVFVWSFTTTTNTATPYVIGILPDDLANTVALNATVEAVFSENMNEDSIDGASFLVVTDKDDPDNTKIAGGVVYDALNRTAVFTPAAPLTADTDYFGIVTTAVKNAGGNPLDAEVVWTFKTTAHTHTIATTWTTSGSSPAVWTNAPISVSFDAPMMASTINAATFTLEQGGNPVDGTVYYNAVQKKATFVPAEPLAADTEYIATLTVDIYCAQGVPFDGDTLTFTTTSDVTPPTVSSTLPADGASNVWVDTTVEAVFSESMSSGSLTTATFLLKKGAVKVLEDTLVYTDGTKKVVFTPKTPLENGVTYTAILSTGVKDANGNPLTADKVWTFTTTEDSVAPAISDNVPADTATEVSITAPVVVTFSEPMDPDTLDATSLVLHTDTDDIVNSVVAVGVTISPDNTTVTLQPSAPLTANTDYFMIVPTDIINGLTNPVVARDASGNALGSDVTWTFKTTTDVTAPTTSNPSPADSDTDVWLDAVVTVEFSEAMDVATLIAANFGLDNGVTGTISYNAATHVATFTPDAPLAANTEYTVTLGAGITDAKGNPLDSAPVAWSFTTTADVTAPVATLATPVTATDVWLDTAIDIDFDDDMLSSSIDETTVTVGYGDPATQISGVVTYSAGTGAGTATFQPDYPLDPDTLYTVRALSGIKDSAGNALSPTSFTFTTTADAVKPSVTAFTPGAGAVNVWLNSAVTVTFSEDIDSDTLDDATTFTLTESGTPVPGTITYADNTATYTPTDPLTGNKTYVVTLTNGIRDLMGNRLSSGVSFSFTTTNDSAAPTVASTAPAAAATGVVLNPPVSVVFSEQMASATIVAANVYLCPSADTATHLPATVSYNAVTKTASIVPDELFAANTSYDINVTTSAKDANGNALGSAFKASFTTVNDGVAPAVSSTVPTADSTTAWVNAPITATFSESVRSATVSGATFTLKKGSDAVSGTVSYNATDFIASFTPSAPLTPGAVYEAKITADVRDIAGNPMAGDETWSFTVTTDIAAPTVTAVTPAASTSNVWVNTPVIATFNESMSDSTITTATFTLKVGVTPVAGTVAYDDGTKKATFTPSAPLALNTVYTATLTTGVKDLGGNPLALAKVWTFTTTADGVIPTVAGVYPIDQATGVSKRETPSVTFSEAMLSSTLTTSNFTLDCGSPVTGAVTYNSVTRTATFTPADPLDASASCTAVVKAAVSDLGGNTLSGDTTWEFTVTGDATEPTVTLAPSPAANAGTIWTGAVVVATFNEAMTTSTINASTVNLKVKSSGAPVSGVVSYDAALHKATFTPNAPLAADTTYTATVTTGVLDAAGNYLADAVTLDLDTTSDVTAPTVTANSPAKGATGVWRDSKVTVTFSEPIATGTIDNTTFFLKQGANSIAAAVTYDTGVATLTPTATLASNTLYTATVTTGVKDENGNALASAYSFSFTTTPDAAQPTITSYTPANAATGVTRKPTVTVTFSEAMTASTVTTANLKVNGGSDVAGVVTYEAATNTAKFVPNALLATNTLYTVTVVKNLKDMNGNQLATDGTWTFTTSTDADAPTITGKTPVAASTTNWPNTAVTVVFNEKVNPASVTSASFNLKVKSSGAGVSGTITYDANTSTARLTPTSALARGVEYTATVADTIVDLAGNALASGASWDFTVSSDAVPPTIASVLPDVSATSVWSDAVVSAVFSESLESSTVSGAVFTLKQGLTPVDGAVTYDDGTKKITFTPTNNLLLNKVYTATISTGVKDKGGNALQAAKVWNFTTTSDVAMPTVISTVPADLENSVSQLVHPTITFSESMTESTITSATLKLDKGGDVSGVVTYDAPSRTATFTPDAALERSGVYTLTAKAAMRDLGGNKMIADKVVTFTVTSDDTLPTVSAKFPVSAETDAWRSTLVKATFSEAMTASSITSATFYVKQGETLVPGTVTYDAATKAAIFTPTALLAANTAYTATVVASVLDAGGNALGTAPDDNVTWNFNTTADGTAPTITSTVPAAAATNVWRSGAPVKVIFSEDMAASTITSATIYLMQGTNLVAGTVAYDAGTKTASFTPTASLAMGAAYTATVTTGVKDLHGNALAALKTWSFTTATDSAKPTVSSTSPVLGATGVSRMPVIGVVFSEAVSVATLAPSFTLKKGATPVTFTASYDSATKTGKFTPDATLDANTVYTAALTTGVRDAAGNQLPADYTWTFTTINDTTAPTVSSLVPLDSANEVSTLASVSAVFSEDMAAASITGTTFTLTRTDSDPDVAVAGAVTYTAATKTAKFAPTAPLAKNAVYEAKLTTSVRDANGNPLASDTTWSFTTTDDNVAPTVSSTSPAASATNVWQSASVSAVFSEDMAATTITTATFTVKKGTVNVAGTVSYDAATKTAKFTPTALLARTSVYTATVTTGAKDAAGNPLAANKVWTFTTTSDAVLPTVTAVSPASYATNVNRTAKLTATFSENMVSSTVTSTTFSLKKGTTVVPGTVTYDTATKKATFTPSSSLSTGTVFTATISGVKDMNGNGLYTAKKWTFTTTSDAVAPTLTTKSPAAGATNVRVRPPITAVFSEAMNAATLTAANCTLKTAAPDNQAVTVALAYNATTRTLTMTPSANLDLDQEYTVTLGGGVQDANGNPLTAVTWNFTTTNDSVAPSVDVKTPAASATGVSMLTTVTAHFDEPMNAATITGTTFTLKAGATAVAATVTYDAAGRVATLKPNAKLLRSTVYTATLTTAVTDAASNALPLTTWIFTTSTDGVAPTVGVLSPASGATGVSMLTTVSATFSEAMAASTITSTNITLKRGTLAVPSTVVYDSGTKKATLTPNAQLLRNTVYTVAIGTNVKDVAGNSLATTKTWTFTTSNDSVAPAIANRNPAPDVGGVDVSTTVVVTFSEAISTTVSAAGVSLKKGATPVAATLAWDVTKKILTITPDADLDEGGRYTVTLTTAVKDVAGNSLGGVNAWDFVVAPGTYVEPNTGIEFVWVNQGSFDMGDTFQTGQADESPVHAVNLTKGFWIGKYELTQAQWEAVTGSNPSYFSTSNGFLACPDCPVESISWDDVQGFLTQAAALTGKNIDLPTEAQWEYAARGGSNGAGFQYAGDSSPDLIGIYDTTAPAEVGSLFPNELDIYDMSGNVWEMVYDYYSDTQYTPDTQTDPSGPQLGVSRVMRGGGWADPATELRLTNRDATTESGTSNDMGVRLVLIP